MKAVLIIVLIAIIAVLAFANGYRYHAVHHPYCIATHYATLERPHYG